MPVKKSLPRIVAVLCLLVAVVAIAPASNCLGNCIGCDSHSPAQCRSLLNADTGKQYSCLPYYTGSNCALTANAYFVTPQSLRISTDNPRSSPIGRSQSRRALKNAH